MEELLSAAEVAELLGKDPSNIRRVAKRIGIGRQIGRAWIFTAAEVEKIRAAYRDGPGSPAFVEGNQLARKGVKARWGKKARKK
jgi:hypothetical protein